MTKDRRVKRISPLLTSPVLPGIGSAFKVVVTAHHRFVEEEGNCVSAGSKNSKTGLGLQS